MGAATQFERGKNVGHGSWCLPVFNLANITAAGDAVTDFIPGFAGKIKKWYWIQGTPVTTAAKAATLNLEVGAVNVEDGGGANSTIALTSAACTPLGKTIAGGTVGARNTFDNDDTISIEAASVTAFVEGAGVIVIEYEYNIL